MGGYGYFLEPHISNHRGRICPPSLTLLSFKTRIEWPPVLIATANFPSWLFQLLRYPRQRSSYSAHRAALMTKTVSIFPAFSSRIVDFAVHFCFPCKFSFHEVWRLSQVWEWRDFLGPIKIPLLCIATNEIASFVQTIDYVKWLFFEFVKVVGVRGKGQLSSHVERFWKKAFSVVVCFFIM